MAAKTTFLRSVLLVLLFVCSCKCQCGVGEDFSVSYGSTRSFTVSQSNGSCSCPGGFAGPGTNLDITLNQAYLYHTAVLNNQTSRLATQAGQILSMQSSISTLQSSSTSMATAISDLQSGLNSAQTSLSTLQTTVSNYQAAKSCAAKSAISAISSAGSATCSSFSKLNWFATPIIYEYGFAGGVGVTLSIPGIAGNGFSAMVANVFYTCVALDHQNIVLGNGCTALTVNYLARGARPSTSFSGTMARNCVLLTYYGDSDPFSSYYGIWYGNQVIPLRPDGQLDFSNWGNNGNAGWIYFVILGYVSG